MAARNPLARITHAAQGAATLPLKATEKVAEQAVGVVAGGVRAASSLISSTAERARSMVSIEEAKTAPAPTDAPPQESVEALAEAAVAREMAEKPQTTTTLSKAARATAPRKTPPRKTPTSQGAPEAAEEPLIDPAVAKAVKSETDTLRAAADRNPDH